MYKYAHGGDIYGEDTKGKKYIDYSINVNPLGIPTGVKNAIKESIKFCANYPDPFCRQLTNDLAKKLHVKKEHILFGNGAADVLFRLVRSIKPKRTLLTAPTFLDYEKAVTAVGSKVEHFYLNTSTYALDDAFLKSITKRVDLVILCNPNNPTGVVIDSKLLLAIVKKCQSMGIMIIIDECFLDFVKDGEKLSLLPKIETYKNLVILKAFTKTYAIPGVRLGYCVTANENIMGALYLEGQDWSVSTLAQAAGIAALNEDSYVKEALEVIEEERQYLCTAFDRFSFVTIPSKANFILFRTNLKFDLGKKLKEKGFIIRDCANYLNLTKGYFRIAVKKRDDNRKLTKAIKEIIRDEFGIGNR